MCRLVAGLRDVDGAPDHRVEHRRRQPARERVLLARVVRAEQRVRPDPSLREMPEPRPRRAPRAPAPRTPGPPRPSRTGRGRRPPAPTRAAPARGPGTARRCRAPRSSACWPAARSGRPPRCTCPSASARRRRAGSRAGPPARASNSRAHRKSPARIAGEDPAGPVAAVRGRRQPQQQDPRIRVAEPRQRPAPVRLVAEPRDLLDGDPLAPLDQPRTPPARDDLAGQRRKGRPVRAHLSRSLSSRRDVTASPISPITDRYATWTSRIGLIAPTVSDRMRSTPWYSGVRRTTTCSDAADRSRSGRTSPRTGTSAGRPAG